LRPRLVWLGLSFVIVVLDQITKAILVRTIDLHGPLVSLIDGVLGLSHVRNYGAAFGFLSDPSIPYQGTLFALLSLVALAAVVWYQTQVPADARLSHLALSLVLGGAVGNLIDRIRLGYVVDFIHVYWGTWSWPDFNVADSAITVGVCLLILEIVRTPSPAKPESSADPALSSDRSQ
jgi:signal peptidase II